MFHRIVGADHSPPVEGWQPMHFVIHVFSSHVEVLHSVTPIDLLAQSVVLSDGVVFCVPTIFTLANRLRHIIIKTTCNALSLQNSNRLRH